MVICVPPPPSYSKHKTIFHAEARIRGFGSTYTYTLSKQLVLFGDIPSNVCGGLRVRIL